MSKIPVVSGAEVIKAFEKIGWRTARQKGSHATMVKEGSRVILTVPLHKEVSKGTLIRKANTTVEEFTKLLG